MLLLLVLLLNLHSVQAFPPQNAKSEQKLHLLQAFRTKSPICAISARKTCTLCRLALRTASD
jgi:hypothetical protein